MMPRKVRVCAKHHTKPVMMGTREYCNKCFKFLMPWGIKEIDEREVKDG